MLQYITPRQKTTLLVLLFAIAGISGYAQPVQRNQPSWWFGVSGAANFNTFRGTTQILNENLTVPTAFHKGKGVKPYGSILLEYRPSKVAGFMLNLAYDNKGGKFDEVIAPCNCPANLTTELGYAVIEPSFRLAPFSSALYLYIGPTVAFNVSRSFGYTQEKQPDTHADWSEVRKTLLGAQAGLGIDIPVSKPASETQMTLSPFVSFQTDLGSSPRKIESLAIYTIRAGMAFKLGYKANKVPAKTVTITNTVLVPAKEAEKDVQFSVRAPKVVPVNRQVKETFPIRKSVFFNMGSTEIPSRYVLLTPAQAAAFKEEQLQEAQPANLSTGRSARQLAVYHNILNIVGDRMRNNSQTTITLQGASDKDSEQGKLMAERVKQYLVNSYGIDPSRITTEGRDKPVIASEQTGGTRELDLLREGDRRVDIVSNSPDMMLQVGGASSEFLKPVYITSYQQDPLDSHVIFTNEGATEVLSSWNVEVTDDQGKMQTYGPYTLDQASVPGKTILQDKTQGNYTITMVGQTKKGVTVRKQSSVSLLKAEDSKQEGLRYSILFDFDKSKTREAYEQFLINIVAPLIADNSTVIIHGHTDVIGEETYNLTLSRERASEAQRILERALSNSGKRGVRFETYGFGEDPQTAPFENNLPEERFYNRSVIIDIIPVK